MKRRTRRWGRILSNTLTAISLLLAIATAGLWVKSAFTMDTVSATYSSGMWASQISLTSERSMLYPALIRYQNERPLNVAGYITFDGYNASWLDDGVELRIWPVMGAFHYSEQRSTANPSYLMRRLQIPHWLLFTVFALIPLSRGILKIRGIKRPGLCPACGYDMRANPAKCSECGHEMPATTEVASA